MFDALRVTCRHLLSQSTNKQANNMCSPRVCRRLNKHMRLCSIFCALIVASVATASLIAVACSGETRLVSPTEPDNINNKRLTKRETPEDASESRQVLNMVAPTAELLSSGHKDARVYTQLSAGGLQQQANIHTKSATDFSGDETSYNNAPKSQAAAAASNTATSNRHSSKLSSTNSKQQIFKNSKHSAPTEAHQEEQDSLVASKIKQNKTLLSKALRKKLEAINNASNSIIQQKQLQQQLQTSSSIASTVDPFVSSESALSLVTSALQSDNLKLLAAAAATTPSSAALSASASTTTPATVSKHTNNPTASFQCPEQFGYYTDTSDCSKYFVCVFGEVLHESCTGGLHFSKELQTCDWPRNVQCKVSISNSNAEGAGAASELMQHRPALPASETSNPDESEDQESDEDAVGNTPSSQSDVNTNFNTSNDSNKQGAGNKQDMAENSNSFYEDESIAKAGKQTHNKQQTANTATTSAGIVSKNSIESNQRQQHQDSTTGESQRLPPSQRQQATATNFGATANDVRAQNDSNERETSMNVAEGSSDNSGNGNDEEDIEGDNSSRGGGGSALVSNKPKQVSISGNSTNPHQQAHSSTASAAASQSAGQGSQRQKNVASSRNKQLTSANGNSKLLKAVQAPPTRSQQAAAAAAAAAASVAGTPIASSDHVTADTGSDPQQPSFDEATAPIITQNGDIHVHDGPGGTFGLIPAPQQLAAKPQSASLLSHNQQHAPLTDSLDVFVRPVITNAGLAPAQHQHAQLNNGQQRARFVPATSQFLPSSGVQSSSNFMPLAIQSFNDKQQHVTRNTNQISNKLTANAVDSRFVNPHPTLISSTTPSLIDNSNVDDDNSNEEDDSTTPNDDNNAASGSSLSTPPTNGFLKPQNNQRGTVQYEPPVTIDSSSRARSSHSSFSPTQSFRPVLMSSSSPLPPPPPSSLNTGNGQNFAPPRNTQNQAQIQRNNNFNALKFGDTNTLSAAPRNIQQQWPSVVLPSRASSNVKPTENLQLISEGGESTTRLNSPQSDSNSFFPTLATTSSDSNLRHPKHITRNQDLPQNNFARNAQPQATTISNSGNSILSHQNRRPRPPKRQQIPTGATQSNLNLPTIATTNIPPHFAAPGERNSWPPPTSLSFSQQDAIGNPGGLKPAIPLRESNRSAQLITATSEQPPQAPTPTINNNDEETTNEDSTNETVSPPTSRFSATTPADTPTNLATNPELNAGEPFGAVDYESDVENSADRRIPQSISSTTPQTTTTSTSTTTTTTTTPSNVFVGERQRQTNRQRTSSRNQPSRNSENNSNDSRSTNNQHSTQQESNARSTTTTTTTSATTGTRGSRPRMKKIQIDHEAAIANNRASTEPAKRPDSLFSTPHALKNATKCDNKVCRLPDCKCGDAIVPNNLDSKVIPQIVLLTFDDAVNDLNWEIYEELFTGRSNPNGCPVLATFYVSHEWTDYGQVQSLYSRGHEMASHSVTHSFGEKFSKNQWLKEINGQREILNLYGGVKMNDVRGMRAPFLQIGGNKMFEMLYDANFTYDSSMPIFENMPPMWPYTLDYALTHECMIAPCPTKSFPGVWEVGMTMWLDLRGGRCSMGDACSNPSDEDGVYEMLMKNFNRHYKSNRAPFGLFYHSAWFNTVHHRRGFLRFMENINSFPDVFFVTNWQMIQWMRQPTQMKDINSFEPWQCPARNDRPPPCYHPSVCNVKSEHGTRFMKTCQPCPANQQYPWVGATGFQPKQQ